MHTRVLTCSGQRCDLHGFNKGLSRTRYRPMGSTWTQSGLHMHPILQCVQTLIQFSKMFSKPCICVSHCSMYSTQAFVHMRIINRAESLPFSLAVGDIEQNLEDLKNMSEPPQDYIAAKIWKLLRSGSNGSNPATATAGLATSGTAKHTIAAMAPTATATAAKTSRPRCASHSSHSSARQAHNSQSHSSHSSPGQAAPARAALSKQPQLD